MDKQKHTPGPWKLSSIYISICGTRRLPKPECPVKAIDIYAPNAKVPGRHNITTLSMVVEDESEQLADARLIAAAPELLEAAKLGQIHLSAILNIWRDELKNNDAYAPIENDLLIIESAIAKAEKGESS